MNDFKVGLISRIPQKKQEEIIMEKAKSGFFKLLNGYDFANGETLNFNQALQTIFSTCGIKNREMQMRIRKHLKGLMKSEKYLVKVDDKDQNIISNYDEYSLLQRTYQQRENEKARATLDEYYQRIMDCAKGIENQVNKKQILEERVKSNFNSVERQKHGLMINLAMEKFLSSPSGLKDEELGK